MEFLFGKKKTPEEMLKQNQRALNRAMRLVSILYPYFRCFSLAYIGAGDLFCKGRVLCNFFRLCKFAKNFLFKPIITILHFKPQTSEYDFNTWK